MGKEDVIHWKPFTPDTMPPVDNRHRFLVLLGLSPADRILCVGVHCQYNGAAPYIRIVGGNKGWEVLTEEQLADAAWYPVEIADEAVKAAKHQKARIMRKQSEMEEIA